MNNKDVVKKAIEAAAAKAGISDVKDFLKKKGADIPESEPKREKYCNGDCQKGSVVTKEAVAPEPEKKRTTPIWPLPDDETPEQFYARLALERKEADKKREEFLKSLDTPEHLAAVRASAVAAVALLPTRHISTSVADKKREDKEEKRVAKAKVKEEKKEGRQTRLGQTKLIDTLLKAGKTEKEIFDTVREKIPSYPADKLPKLIKLRQYHVKK